MDNIIQVNTAESQTIEVYYQDCVDLELDLQLMYIKSGEAEISNYVNKVTKPEIDNYIETQAEPIVAKVVEKIAEPTVNEYLDAVTKPAIDKYVDGKKTELQEYIALAESRATSAAGSAENALASEENAVQMATNSAQSAESSEQSAQSATQSANSASESAELAQSWAVGEIDARPEGSSKYWAELAQGFYPVGAMLPYAGDTPPEGWLVCDGSIISRTDYAELFAIIGEIYGDGDGATTFSLPNFINRTFWGGSGSGAVKVAGLPDITGQLASMKSGRNNKTGAFLDSNVVSDSYVGASQQTGYIAYLDFKASNSNSVYGNSSTVQPPALQTLVIIKY